MQAVLVDADVPRAMVLAIERVATNECEAALGVLVKLLIPEHAHNEAFAQQLIAVRPLLAHTLGVSDAFLLGFSVAFLLEL